MPKAEKKSLATPDDTRKFNNGAVEVVNVAGGSVGRYTFAPGWKWSQDVKPIAGTDHCMSEHHMYQISGVMHVVMADGTELDMRPGDVGIVPPGHDAWVVGNEPVVGVDWAGMANYGKR